MGDNQLCTMMIGIAIVGIWWWAFTLFPLKSFNQICLDVRKLPEAFRFLVGCFMLADSTIMIMTVASLLAQAVINMDEDQMAIGILIVPTTSMIGAFGLWMVQERFNYQTRTLALVAFYTLVAYFGIINGASIALTRAQFVELCPLGMEAEFFSLFRITDKGSAFIGPLVAAGINTTLHNLRYAYVWCPSLLFLSGVLFHWCNTKKGREDVPKMSTLSGVTSDDPAGKPKAFL
ncbi:Autophagy protein 22 [Linderina pennispora]|nr:Autophagy protein 22 [Linderina pennispora]